LADSKSGKNVVRFFYAKCRGLLEMLGFLSSGLSVRCNSDQYPKEMAETLALWVILIGKEKIAQVAREIGRCGSYPGNPDN
jgi:hypothetical protein